MVFVTPRESVLARIEAERKNKEDEENRKKVEEYLIRTGELVGINLDEKYVYDSGHVKSNQSYFIDEVLKINLDKFLTKAVDIKWDGVFLVTGIEGAGKSTIGITLCHYLDPTFPGELIGDGTARRHCDRIVFTPQEFYDAVDCAKPKQAIQFDEAILGFMAGDAGLSIQKMLMRKMTLIRKKQLYIALVIPSIFSMRMPIAVARSRFVVHTFSPDGIKRGWFKFYNYPTKRELYMKGKRDFNQGAVRENFKGVFTNTEGLFCDVKEYDRKKDNAIRNLTEMMGDKKSDGGVLYKTRGQRNLLLAYLYSILEGTPIGRQQLDELVKLHNIYSAAVKPHDRFNATKFSNFLKNTFGEHLTIGDSTIREYLASAKDYISRPLEPIKTEEKKLVDLNMNDATEMLDKETIEEIEDMKEENIKEDISKENISSEDIKEESSENTTEDNKEDISKENISSEDIE